MMEGYQTLFDKLGYRFTNQALLEQALRHRSVRGLSNERLEFLGDAALNFIIAAELFYRYPDLKEGELSRLRANLVNGEVLAVLARELQIGEYLQFGSGELKSRVVKRQSILADAMEALIGAIYLDGGLAVTQTRVLTWFTRLLTEAAGVPQKDPKTRLQELLQMRRLPLPVYTVTNMVGAAHSRTFTVSCKVVGVGEVTYGVGPNKRTAEQDAAQNMLLKIEDDQK